MPLTAVSAGSSKSQDGCWDAGCSYHWRMMHWKLEVCEKRQGKTQEKKSSLDIEEKRHSCEKFPFFLEVVNNKANVSIKCLLQDWEAEKSSKMNELFHEITKWPKRMKEGIYRQEEEPVFTKRFLFDSLWGKKIEKSKKKNLNEECGAKDSRVTYFLCPNYCPRLSLELSSQYSWLLCIVINANAKHEAVFPQSCLQSLKSASRETTSVGEETRLLRDEDSSGQFRSKKKRNLRKRKPRRAIKGMKNGLEEKTWKEGELVLKAVAEDCPWEGITKTTKTSKT